MLGIALMFSTSPPEVGDYRDWTRLTPAPVQLYGYFAWMCAPPPIPDPHGNRWIHVYVNEAGSKAASSGMKAKKTAFPVGSVIVKSKLPDPKKPSDAELVTVMEKVGKKYASKTGGWRFSVMDGDAKRMLSGKGVEHCWSCHKDVKKTDYVFLKYGK